MEKARLIYRCDSESGARTMFTIKNKPTNGTKLRIVQNFIPLNRCTRKSRYPTPHIAHIVLCIYKNAKNVFFITDAANSCYAIPLCHSDWLLTAFIRPNGEYCNGVMCQGLTGGVHTYSCFRDFTFGNIPADDISGTPAFPLIISDRGDVAFDYMVDDSYGSTTNFETIFKFLHEEFFQRSAFGPIYLKRVKSYFSYPSLEFLGLKGCIAGL